MSDRSMEEKRKYIRLNVPLNVKYRTLTPEPSEGKSKSKNISPEGMRIGLKCRLELGVELALIIEIPNESQPISAKGKVVWQKEITDAKPQEERFDTGLQLTYMDDFDKSRFFTYLYDLMYKMLENTQLS